MHGRGSKRGWMAKPLVPVSELEGELQELLLLLMKDGLQIGPKCSFADFKSIQIAHTHI